MKPQQIAKSNTEHAHQKAFFAYVNLAKIYGFNVVDRWIKDPSNLPVTSFSNIVPNFKEDLVLMEPALEWVHAIPNGGSRGDSKASQKIRGSQLKAEGVKRGVLDIFVPWPVRVNSNLVYHGLYIEMKKPAAKPKIFGKGGVSEEQEQFIKYATKNKYACVVCYSWLEAINALKSYIKCDIGRKK